MMIYKGTFDMKIKDLFFEVFYVGNSTYCYWDNEILLDQLDTRFSNNFFFAIHFNCKGIFVERKNYSQSYHEGIASRLKEK